MKSGNTGRNVFMRAWSVGDMNESSKMGRDEAAANTGRNLGAASNRYDRLPWKYDGAGGAFSLPGPPAPPFTRC